MNERVATIVSVIDHKRLSLQNEKTLQAELEEAFKKGSFSFEREKKLDQHNIPDFFFPPGIAVEVKIKGSAREIYNQVARYAEFEEVQAVLLITNRSMGFPQFINGKPAYYFKLGRAWL